MLYKLQKPRMFPNSKVEYFSSEFRLSAHVFSVAVRMQVFTVASHMRDLSCLILPLLRHAGGGRDL